MKTKVCNVCMWAVMLSVTACGNNAPRQVAETVKAVNKTNGVTIVAGKLTLPASEQWWVLPESVQGGMAADVVMTLPEKERLRLSEITDPNSLGYHFQRESRLKDAYNRAYPFVQNLQSYAIKHDGKLPATAKEWDEIRDQSRDADPFVDYRFYPDDESEGPFWGMLSNVVCHIEERTYYGTNVYHSVTNTDIILVELRPLYDDGKHVIARANGVVERVPIDTALMKKYGFIIRPLENRNTAPQDIQTVVYQIMGRYCAAGSLNFTVTNAFTGAALPCIWTLDALPSIDADDTQAVIRDWAIHRGFQWFNMTSPGGAHTPLLSALATLTDRLYESRLHGYAVRDRQSWRRDESSTTAFGMLGGQAALQETLQMNPLVSGAGHFDPRVASASVAEIKGVEVASHPYEEMLGGKEGGRLALAESVPADRFFVYAAKPAALRAYLKDGAAFVARTGELATGRAFNYGLADHYMRRLGVTPELLDEILKLNLISEAALFTPDLFFVDGTEVTLVCRMPQLNALLQVLQFAGVSSDTEKPVRVVSPVTGSVLYAAAKGDLLVIGTHESEAASSLALIRAGGEGSLGKSAEFRYMLTQLPLQDTTRLYTYFSDSFIRRLVGPEVKIGQLRRLASKARMTEMFAARTLWQLDGQKGEATIPALQKAGYLPAGANALVCLTFDETGVPQSEQYGLLADMASLLRIPVDKVTSAEVRAYTTYRDNYARYWRQYFDPVAMRLDDTEDGGLALTTFILPLIDNSLYNSLKQSLSGNESKPVRQLAVMPPPPLMLSMNFNDKTWGSVLKDILPAQEAANSPLAMQFISALDSGVHLIIHDSNPVLAFGSGEMLSLGGFITDSQNTLMIPMFISMLTRPCTAVIELQDAGIVRQAIESGVVRMMLMRKLGRSSDTNMDIYRLSGQDAWILKMDIMGIVLRIKAELSGNFLLVHNIPWTPRMRIEEVPRNQHVAAEATLYPGGAMEQAGAMFTAAQERQRETAFHGAGYLAPFIASGLSLDQAMARHQEVFGFTPRHPGNGAWVIENGRLTSTRYGNAGHSRQPDYTGDAGGGILQGVEMLRVGMQFENSGLRTVIRWRYRRPEP